MKNKIVKFKYNNIKAKEWQIKLSDSNLVFKSYENYLLRQPVIHKENLRILKTILLVAKIRDRLL